MIQLYKPPLKFSIIIMIYQHCRLTHTSFIESLLLVSIKSPALIVVFFSLIVFKSLYHLDLTICSHSSNEASNAVIKSSILDVIINSFYKSKFYTKEYIPSYFSRFSSSTFLLLVIVFPIIKSSKQAINFFLHQQKINTF